MTRCLQRGAVKNCQKGCPDLRGHEVIACRTPRISCLPRLGPPGGWNPIVAVLVQTAARLRGPAGATHVLGLTRSTLAPPPQEVRTLTPTLKGAPTSDRSESPPKYRACPDDVATESGLSQHLQPLELTVVNHRLAHRGLEWIWLCVLYEAAKSGCRAIEWMRSTFSLLCPGSGKDAQAAGPCGGRLSRPYDVPVGA